MSIRFDKEELKPDFVPGTPMAWGAAVPPPPADLQH
jgi:hypothetical protein